MNSKNRIGPRTLPWITPALTAIHSVGVRLCTTRWRLWVKYEAIHEKNHLGSRLSSFSRSTSWSTRSNALAKSKNMASSLLLRSTARPQSSTTCRTASMVDFPGRNPYCLLVSHMFIVVERMYLATILFIILHIADVTATGRSQPAQRHSVSWV